MQTDPEVTKIRLWCGREGQRDVEHHDAFGGAGILWPRDTHGPHANVGVPVKHGMTGGRGKELDTDSWRSWSRRS